MARVLLSGFRVRMLDGNGNPPAVPWRMYFTDSSTTSPKEVYSGPEALDPSLGAYVDFDAQGWGPANGIWLEEGLYNIQVQSYISGDPSDPANWAEQWTINKVQGAISEADLDGTIITVSTVAEIRALSGSSLGGTIFNTGYYALNDGGQGQWRWVASSTEDDDGGSILKPTGLSPVQPGRWFRVFPTTGEISVQLFGAVSSAADVTGNLTNAINWATRTSTDTGTILAFPSGQYNISGNMVFGGVGVTPLGVTIPVSYHVHQGARFQIPNLSVAPIFTNRVAIDSHSFVCSTLAVVETTDGYVDPRWWGAGGVGLDASTPWNFMVSVNGHTGLPRYGNNAIRIQIPYLLESATVSQSKPTYVFGTAGSIELGVSVTQFNLDKIIDQSGNNTEPLITGNLQAMRYYGREFYARWTKPTTANMLANTVRGVYYGDEPKPIIWDYPFTFDQTYGEPFNVVHVFQGGGHWDIGNESVEVYAIDAPETTIFSMLSGGLLNMVRKVTLKAAWFGMNSGNVNNSLRSVLRQVENFGYSVDFGGRQYNVEVPLTLTLPEDAEVRFDRLYLDSITGNGRITVTGHSTATFTLTNSELESASIILITNSIGRVRVANNGFAGQVVFDSSSAEKDILGNTFRDGRVTIVTRGAEGEGRQAVLMNNNFDNSILLLTCGDEGTTSRIQQVTVANNHFYNRGALTNDFPAFIRLVAVNTDCMIEGVLIQGNNYSNTITSGWTPGVYATNVMDVTSVTNTWRNETGSGGTPYSATWTWHNLVIRDEVLAVPPSPFSVTSDFNSSYSTRLLLTEGVSPYNRESPGAGMIVEAVNGFRLSGVLSSRCEPIWVSKKALPSATGQEYVIFHTRPPLPVDGAFPPDGQVFFAITGFNPSRAEGWFHFRLSL